ncbi:Ribonucleoside-diphosphate reductase large subunit [Platanthera zijinensis]|uniref:Ribonucleoside-diphosphate reductase large subunit n=1 Tax=Platanthera zijinensis TaxID=2320716 RepID=A0AAP0BH28_9ASPA
MKKKIKFYKYEKGSSQFQPPPPPPPDSGSGGGSASLTSAPKQIPSQSSQRYHPRGQYQRGYQSRRGQYRGNQRDHRIQSRHQREGQRHLDSSQVPFPYKLRETVNAGTVAASENFNRYEPAIPFEDPENNPLSLTARMKEHAALDQLRNAREQGKDTSNIFTLLEQRKAELERYASRKFFDPVDYMKLHPEAVVPRARSQTSLGAEDDKKARKLNKYIFETIYYHALDASSELSSKEGPYETYHGSLLSKGILQPVMWDVAPSCQWD